MLKTAKCLFFCFILTSIFISCKSKTQKSYKQDVSDNISYLEMPAKATIADIMKNEQNFKPLPKEKYSQLNKILENKSNFIWLKLSFTVDYELKDKMIALYIAQLQSAANLWCNGIFIRRYGNFPPNEMNCGTAAQYYMLPKQIINYESENSILIQVWPGPLGMISNKIFIGEQPSIFKLAERHTFFNSKIIIAFMAITFLIFFLYLTLFIILRKNINAKSYIYYSFLSLFTALFLLPFGISEISWALPPSVSYLHIIKFFFCISAILTIYFSYSFMISYLELSIPKVIRILRLLFTFISIILVLIIPNYNSLPIFMLFLLVFPSFDIFTSTFFYIKSFFNKEKNKNALKFSFGFMPIIISVTCDVVLRVFFKFDDIPYITIYGWQITIYIFLSYLVQQFGSTYVHNLYLKGEVEKLNTNLEEIVAMRTKELSEANYILSRGLESVSQVQRNFLPQKEHLFKGWDLSVYYKPLDNNVSGDLYDYYYSDSDFLDGFGIFDVSGHGIQAGLMTILSKGIISQHFIGGLEQKLSLSQVLQEINSTYIKEKVDVDNYITGLLFRFSNFDKNDVCTAELANAGHPYPLFYNSKEHSVSELKYTGPEKQFGFIGVDGFETSFPAINLPISNNDIILCFTDGLTEATNSKNEDFSKSRIMDLLKENAHLNSNEIIEKIVSEFNKFTQNSEIHDDITLIVLKRNNSKTFLEGI